MLRFVLLGAFIVAGLGFLFVTASRVPSASGASNQVQCRVRAAAGQINERACSAAENRGCTAPITVKLEGELVSVPPGASATVFCGGGVANGGSEATCVLGFGVSSCEVTNTLFSTTFTTGNGCRVSAVGMNSPAVAVCTFTTP
jgi:hypothetical protein